jgi:hypothetical protein
MSIAFDSCFVPVVLPGVAFRVTATFVWIALSSAAYSANCCSAADLARMLNRRSPIIGGSVGPAAHHPSAVSEA